MLNQPYQNLYVPQYQTQMQQMFQPQQQYQMPAEQQSQISTPQIQNDQTIVWGINGKEAAEKYLVAPNHTVQLWDITQHTIYLKTADGMTILDYTIREDKKPVEADVEPQVSKKDFDSLQAQLDSLKKQIEVLNKKPNNTKKEVAE